MHSPDIFAGMTEAVHDVRLQWAQLGDVPHRPAISFIGLWADCAAEHTLLDELLNGAQQLDTQSEFGKQLFAQVPPPVVTHVDPSVWDSTQQYVLAVHAPPGVTHSACRDQRTAPCWVPKGADRLSSAHAPLFEFELTPVECVAPWGEPLAQSLSWFALTDGAFRMPVGTDVLFSVHGGGACALGGRSSVARCHLPSRRICA